MLSLLCRRSNQSLSARACLSSKKAQESRGAQRTPLSKTVGDTVSGYLILEDKAITERNLRLLILEHKKTKAKHIHLETDDTNNAFTVIFKTQPTDNTGKAHILEHMALCGSEKYPVRDPFFHMTTRSVNTYMNAWTGNDFTQYPFSTQNLKDFNNLLSIYLDAAFSPLLSRMDFLQEGWRLERAGEPGDAKKTKKVVYKGVVYNEMKGAMSDPSRIFYQQLVTELFPGTPYALNNGGEPHAIPDLTHEQLKAFHQQHYHPSNATFLTYGDLPLQRHLQKINVCLSSFTNGPSQDLQPPASIEAPITKTVSLPVTPGAAENAQHRVALAWALPPTADDVFRTFSLSVLSTLLVDGPNAPLYQALIDSGLGADYSPGTGYESSIPRGVFSVGLCGVKKENVPLVSKAIMAGLQKAATEGFSTERIEAILHQMEIGIKYVRGNFGIELIGGFTSPLIHGANVVESLSSVSLIERLRTELGMPAGEESVVPTDYFQRLIKEHLLSNDRRLTIEGRPDAKYTKRQEAAEQRALKKLVLSEAAEREAAELLQRQQETPNVDCLPKLKVPDDINPNTTPVPFDRTQLRAHSSHGEVNAEVLWANQPTNSLVSFRMINLLPGLDELPLASYPYLPFFCFIFNQVGTKKRSYADLSQRIESSTASVSASIHAVQLPGSSDAELGVEFSGICLERNQATMFDILLEILTETSNFEDHARLDALLQMYTTACEDKLVSSGHSLAVVRSKAALSPFFALADIWDGISGLKLFQSLTASRQRGEPCFDELVQHLQSIARAVCSVSSHTRCLVNSEASSVPIIQPAIQRFIAGLASSSSARLGSSLPVSLMASTTTDGRLQETIEAPATVSFVGRSLPGPASFTADSVGLALGTGLLSKRYLHNEIREKGGAYGAGLSNGNNLLSYYTFRDPNPVNSMRIFDGSLEWLEQPDSLSKTEVQEAKLRIFGHLDSPVPPTKRGLRYFRTHVTDEMDQQQRIALLSCTKKQILEAARRYLNPEAVKHTAVVCSPEVRDRLQDFTPFTLKQQ